MSRLGQWLGKLGLQRHEALFAANDIDFDALPHVTDQDLKDLGLTLGHRRKLLAAIAGLGAPSHRRATAVAVPLAAPERRQLTVLFSDLADSTALSARLDPEEMGEILRAYHRAATAAIVRFEGHVAKYLGDGVLAYFGYPRAHEDDAERAVRAGLAIAEAVRALHWPGEKALQVRVGIATGRVVVGDLIGEGAAQEETVVGETPNLAARLQALAEPNTVLIAAGTHRLVGRWERVIRGEGQVVLLTGEPGIGKSRIVKAC